MHPVFDTQSLVAPILLFIIMAPSLHGARARASTMPHQRVEDMISKGDTNLQIPTVRV